MCVDQMFHYYLLFRSKAGKDPSKDLFFGLYDIFGFLLSLFHIEFKEMIDAPDGVDWCGFCDRQQLCFGCLVFLPTSIDPEAGRLSSSLGRRQAGRQAGRAKSTSTVYGCLDCSIYPYL